MYANYELCFIYASGSVPIQFQFDLNLLLLSRDGPATANELLAIECPVSTSERCCEEVNITEMS